MKPAEAPPKAFRSRSAAPPCRPHEWRSGPDVPRRSLPSEQERVRLGPTDQPRAAAMNEHLNYRRVGVIAAVAVVASLLIAWAGRLFPQRKVVAFARLVACIPFLLLILAAGCATKPPSLVIAYGRWMNQHDEGSMRLARYEISGVCRGHLPTNIIFVVFYSSTQTGELPKDAILLLRTKPSPGIPDVWYSIGMRASHGILQDTPANRQMVASTAAARLLRHPKGEWLPKRKAEQLVRRFLTKQGAYDANTTLELKRDAFGWSAFVLCKTEDGEYLVGGHGFVGIDDTGDIIHLDKGL
jgi:hypothetical protein